MRRVIVCGGRKFDDMRILAEAFKVSGFKPEIIVQGECPTGADLLARRYAWANGIELESFPPRWKLFGKAAGPKRNAEMAEACIPGEDGCIALPGGKGTESMVREAKKRGLRLWIADDALIVKMMKEKGWTAYV